MNRNTRVKTSRWIFVFIILIVLVIDQALKIWVKTNMYLGETIRITDWFYIDFVENNGMAYGMTFVPKLCLSIIRIVVVSWLGYYIWGQISKSASTKYVVLLSMVFAGAIGNIIDNLFYGLVFSASSPFYVSYFVPFGNGYAGFLTGKVVDMFYFPLVVTTWPDWFPFYGGEEFIFFSPVFNFADACISVGFILLLLLCRGELSNIFTSEKAHKKDAKDEE